MRVLFLSFPYESAPGGGERYTEQTIDGFRAAGHEAYLVSSSRAMLGLFRRRDWPALPLWGGVEPVSKASIAVFPLAAPFFFALLAGVTAWFRFKRGVGTVVCLSLTDKLLVTLPARLMGLRVLWMEHLVAGRSLAQNPFRGTYAALSRLARVVAVSEATADSIASLGVPRARISVITPGVAPEAHPAKELRHQGAPVIGAISRLSREKNVALLLRAFALVQKEIPETELHLYGDGPERRDLEALTESLGIGPRVRFFGHVEGIGRSCGQFNVLAVPSSREAFGMAALEAMNCGVPVVATRVGGLKELVVDGETGALVPPEDDRAFADALLAMLRDPERAAAMGAAGQARAATRFSEAKMHDAWTKLLSSR